MKKLVCLVLVLAASSVAMALSGNVLEDFEGMAVDSWLMQDNGWYGYNNGQGFPMDAKIIVGYDGTKSLWDTGDETHGYYYQCWNGGVGGDGTPAFENPLIDAGSTWNATYGESHMAMTFPYAYDTTFGLQRQDGYPGPIIGGGLRAEAGPGYDHSLLQVQPGLWGTTVYSTTRVEAWHVIDLVMNMTTVDNVTTGTLYYKDITRGDTVFTITDIVDLDLNNPGWMTLYNRLYVRGAFYGEQDDLAFGEGFIDVTGYVPEPATIALLGLGGLLLRKRR